VFGRALGRKRLAMRFNIRQRAPRRAGFTIVELLVVIAIIGVLVAIVLPAVQAAREAARRAQCQSNLRQLAVALALHANAQGAFPIGCLGYRGDFTVAPPVPARNIAWNVPLLPFLEEKTLAGSIDMSRPTYDAVNKTAAATVVSVFLCPSTPDVLLNNDRGAWKGAAFTDYGGIYGVEGPSRAQTNPGGLQTLAESSLGVLLYDQPVAPKQVSDGLSKTAAIAEIADRRRTECEWINGQNLFAQEEATPMNTHRDVGNEIGSPHSGGASLAFCDGHIEFVAESIEQIVLNAMLTKAGGE
jgi:prepilin-type N-terminal cleavage/methylation domain-containing protein/prepilin-type processing-associated H-X9-DG protein